MGHHCAAVVVTCMDFRLHEFLDRWLVAHVGYGQFDRVCLAGSVKNWDTVLPQIVLSRRLHDSHRVILINHEDCGAYGASGSRERHASDLRLARQSVLDQFPGAEVELYYATLDGNVERID